MGNLSLEFYGVSGMAELHHTNGEVTATKALNSENDVSGIDFTEDASPKLTNNLFNIPGIKN